MLAIDHAKSYVEKANTKTEICVPRPRLIILIALAGAWGKFQSTAEAGAPVVPCHEHVLRVRKAQSNLEIPLVFIRLFGQLSELNCTTTVV